MRGQYEQEVRRKNGLLYALDRGTGEVLMSRRFIDALQPRVPATNWGDNAVAAGDTLFALALR